MAQFDQFISQVSEINPLPAAVGISPIAQQSNLQAILQRRKEGLRLRPRLRLRLRLRYFYLNLNLNLNLDLNLNLSLLAAQGMSSS
jgi:hypothetical protein